MKKIPACQVKVNFVKDLLIYSGFKRKKSNINVLDRRLYFRELNLFKNFFSKSILLRI